MQEVSDSKQPFVNHNGKKPEVRVGEILPAQDLSSRASSASLEEALLALELFETNSDAFLLVDPETDLIKAANPACHRLFGYEMDELAGRSYYSLLQTQGYPVYQRQKTLVRAGKPTESRGMGLHKNGKPIFVKVEAKPLVYQGKTDLLLTIRQTLIEQNGKITLNPVLNSLTNLIANTAISETNHKYAVSFEELNPLIQVILSQLKLRLQYSSAATLAVQDDEFNLIDCEFSKVQFPGKKWLHLALVLTQLGEETLLRGIPVVVPDLEMRPELEQELAEYTGMFPDLQLEALVGSWLAVPLIIEGQVVGAISLLSEWPNHFSADDLRIVTGISSRAMLTHSRMYKRLQTRVLETERIRLARELHDSVNQNLYGIQLLANTALALLEQGKTDELVGYLKKINAETGEGTMALRSLLLELRPEFLETAGLVVALQKQVEGLNYRKLKIETRFDPEPRISSEQKEVFYFIGREALHNAAKHAKATRLNLALYHEASNLILEIRDNGQGFDPQAFYQGHIGLYSMRERAALIEARLEISSQPGQGTLVRLALPVQT
jgi:PAS domain S-box-containing protein